MSLAPICLFTYNRLEETKKTIEALQKNHLASQSQLFLFSDGWKKIENKDRIIQVRDYLDTVDGFEKVTVIHSKKNKGLAESIIEGVTRILSQYDHVIVLEDDLITTPNFLDFMNQALAYYKDEERVQSVSGYSLKIKSKPADSDVYLHRRAYSWGWGTWSNRWDTRIFDKDRIRREIESHPEILTEFRKTCGHDMDGMLLDSLNGKNDSWYVRWSLDHFKHDRLSVYPVYSKVSNIGFSDEGTHCKAVNVFEGEIDQTHKRDFTFSMAYHTPQITHEFLNYFTKSYKLQFRLKMMKSSAGRKELLKDVKYKFIKYSQIIKEKSQMGKVKGIPANRD